MDLSWLEDFAALAKTGNFSRAAEKRHITQPAFSRRIQSLEEWLGTKLFARERQKAVLTRAGAELLPEAEVMIRTMHRLRRIASESAAQKTAVLHFAATHSLSLGFFPVWIKQYAHCADRYAINLVSDTMAACEDALLQGRVQFLLCHEPSSAPQRFVAKGFPSLAVGTDTLSPYSAPRSSGNPLWTLAEPSCPQAPWLQYSQESAFSRMMAGHGKIAEYMSTCPASFTARLATVLLSVACDGKGITWLPASLAAPAVAEGRLVKAGDAAWDIPMDIRLFRSGDDHSEGTRGLWDAIAV